MELDIERMNRLADEHALWFVGIIEPLLCSFMEHGYKHGFEDASKEKKRQREEQAE